MSQVDKLVQRHNLVVPVLAEMAPNPHYGVRLAAADPHALPVQFTLR